MPVADSTSANSPNVLITADAHVGETEALIERLPEHLRKFVTRLVLAENGERALEIVDSQPIDLIVLDIMMPGITGFEVLERLRRKYSPAELPIIMASAKSSSQDIVQSAELGANDHVGKPLDFEVIQAKVQALLRLKVAAGPGPAKPKTDDEPTTSKLQAGLVIANKYLLVGKIGAGAFGTVYKARHLKLDLNVAVKILKPGIHDKKALERFQQEGVAAGRIRHPSAVGVFDCGITGGGVAFLVMELLEGESLADELQASERLSPRRVNQILQPICEVLAEAHEQGLVHRDIKPENIYLHQTTGGEVVKVLDFGTAKLVGEAAMQSNLTAEGWILGTFAYMAPERFANEGYDGRSDIYSLGVMLFEMLTGEKPYGNSAQNLMSFIAQHACEEPRTLRSVVPELPAELEGPISQALAKDPQERPDAASFASAFARSVESSSPPEGDAGSPEAETVVLDQPNPTVAIEGPGAEDGLLGRWLKKLKE